MDSETWLSKDKFNKMGKSMMETTVQSKIDDAITINAYFRTGVNNIGRLL